MWPVSTFCEYPNVTRGANDTNNHTLAFHPIRDWHNGTTPNWKEAIQVPHHCNRLLHKVCGSNAISNDHRSQDHEFRMEEHCLQIRDPSCNHIVKWEAVWQPKFRKFCQDLDIKNHYSSPRLPQANGQTEVTNRNLLKIIKTWLEGVNGAWPKEIPKILWAYRTTTRVPTGETPFRLTFETEAIIPVEVGLTNIRIKAYEE